MDLLSVAINVIAIIAIIAVAAFIFVFLSDMLISIIDDHQGIFFKRKRGRDEEYIPSANYNNQNALGHNVSEGLNLDFNNNDFVDADKPQAQLNMPAPGSQVDMDAARREQEMIEQAGSNSFMDAVEEEEDEEDKLQRERIERLERRNKELEEELKEQEEDESNEDEIEVPKALDSLPKFEDLYLDSGLEKEEEINHDDDDLTAYENMIKQINSRALADISEKTEEVKQELEESGTDALEVADEMESLKQRVKADIDALVKETIAEEEEVVEEEEVAPVVVDENLTKQIEELKAQLEQERQEKESLKKESKEKAENLIKEKEELEKALESAKEVNKDKIDTVSQVLGTEEEYVSRLEVLNLRLKEAKKQLRKNKSEFVPLNKIKRTLESDQRKLRRKEAKVAKQKIALFGVNNNDIDPEKQAELEQEIDMLEGLKLSVQHCEDVMKENEDRFPILKNTHDILTRNIKDLTADIENIEAKLKEVKGDGDADTGNE